MKKNKVTANKMTARRKKQRATSWLGFLLLLLLPPLSPLLRRRSGRMGLSISLSLGMWFLCFSLHSNNYATLHISLRELIPVAAKFKSLRTESCKLGQIEQKAGDCDGYQLLYSINISFYIFYKF